MKSSEKLKMALTVAAAALLLLVIVIYVVRDTGKNSSTDNISVEYMSGDSENVAEAGTNSDSDPADASTAATTDSVTRTSSESASTLVSSNGTIYKDSISGNSFYPDETAVLKNIYKNVSFDVERQLSELASYFEQGNDAAVVDLVSLDRYEAMSYSLTGTSNYYYYGETNSDGLPNGKGLAVYGENQYYYGEWVDGVRSGAGGWYQFYPDYDTYVVSRHQYVGQWASDLPNGQGQEHYDYNVNYMDESSFYIQNVIGNFVDGYYDGEIYLISIGADENTKEWYGNLVKGKFVVYGDPDAEGRYPVLQARLNESDYFWMVQAKLENNRINNIIYNGSMVVVK